MKKLFTYCLIFLGLNGLAQSDWDDLSGEERAFFYYMSRTTEILKPELFHLFEFTDSIPWINDTLPDYKYVEKEIIQSPNKLILHADEMARKSNGLVSDLATYYALWELDKVLHYRLSVDEKDKPLKVKLKQFELYVLENIPQSAVTTLTNGEYTILKSIAGYYSPSLSVSDKLAALKNSGFPQSEQMLIINSIMLAQEKYVHQRSYEMYTLLGGKCEDYKNYLSAVGDGASWSELEGSTKNPFNKSLPDDRGLFCFEAEEYVEKEEKITGEVVLKKPVVRVKDILIRELKTRRDLATLLHFDVQGFHPQRQTTIVIQKGGASYILYGKNEHRLISPDSTYGEGTTYWRLLWELEHFYIDDLNEKLYGKKGYSYWIEVYEDKMKATEMRIKKTEAELNNLRHQPMGQPKMKKKKIKKKDLDKSDQINGHPTNTLTKNEKKMNIEQNRLVHLNTQWESEKATLAKLKKEMEEAYFLLVKYQTLFDKMQKNLGYIFMEYKQDKTIYTFTDGATFNYATQDFTFPAGQREEVFHVYHISFGERVLSTRIDENFVHINFSSVEVDEKYTHRKIVEDNKPTPQMATSDSIQLMEIFWAVLKHDLKLEMIAEAGGIMGLSNGVYYRDSTLTAEPYSESSFQNSGLTIYRADKTNKLVLRVTAWGVKTIPNNFEPYRAAFGKLKAKNPDLTEVDFYTGIKAHHLAKTWLLQLKSLVPIWFKKIDDQAKLLKALNAVKIKNVQFLQGKVTAKVPALN